MVKINTGSIPLRLVPQADFRAMTFITDLPKLLSKEMPLNETLAALDWTLQYSRSGKGYEVISGKADLWSVLMHIDTPSDIWIRLNRISENILNPLVA